MDVERESVEGVEDALLGAWVVEAEFGVLVQLASQCHHVVDDSRGGIQQVVHGDIMAEHGLVVGTGPRGATMRP